MHGLFEKGITLSGKYRRGIYWCLRGVEPPNESVATLHKKVGDNLRIVRIQGFDELFSDINQRLATESLNPNSADRQCDFSLPDSSQRFAATRRLLAG